MIKVILAIIVLINIGCTDNKRVAEMYGEKQKTLRHQKAESLLFNNSLAEACKLDTNVGLCIAFVVSSRNNKGADTTNNIPRLSNPIADITKTLINVGSGAYYGKLAAGVVTSGYNAIRDTATGVSGENNSIVVNGNYRNNSNDTIDNSDNSIADSYNDNSDNRVSDSYNDNSDNSNNSTNDSYNDSSDNSDNSDHDNVLPVDPIIPD